MELATERHNLLLRFIDYKVSTEDLERKVWEQDVIVKPMTASVRKLKKKVCSLQNGARLL